MSGFADRLHELYCTCQELKKKESERGNVMLNLHLDAFQKRLPFFHRYDHTNYTRCGAVYFVQMKKPPVEVQTEFDKGNWVVKGSFRKNFIR